MISSPTSPAATHLPEVAARLASALAKIPNPPKTRAGIAQALAPTVAALIDEATASSVTTNATPEGDQ